MARLQFCGRTRLAPRGFRTRTPRSTHRFRPAKTAKSFPISPTAAEPCVTASSAYSTWNRRPFGEKVVTSVSYILRFICL